VRAGLARKRGFNRLVDDIIDFIAMREEQQTPAETVVEAFEREGEDGISVWDALAYCATHDVLSWGEDPKGRKVLEMPAYLKRAIRSFLLGEKEEAV